MGQPPPFGSFFRDTQGEAVLVARIRAGEQQALAIAYDLYSQAVYTVALRISEDQGLAEDVLHEVFLNLWRYPLHLGRSGRHLIFGLVREARHLSLIQRPRSGDLPE
jgi:hypothetical protein